MESAITTKGRITIPKAIREHLGLKSGDRVKFFIHLDGSVVLLPKRGCRCRRRCGARCSQRRPSGARRDARGECVAAYHPPPIVPKNAALPTAMKPAPRSNVHPSVALPRHSRPRST
jgi:AbrB family looped-hinge helix DNA binding protein